MKIWLSHICNSCFQFNNAVFIGIKCQSQQITDSNFSKSCKTLIRMVATISLTFLSQRPVSVKWFLLCSDTLSRAVTGSRAWESACGQEATIFLIQNERHVAVDLSHVAALSNDCVQGFLLDGWLYCLQIGYSDYMQWKVSWEIQHEDKVEAGKPSDIFSHLQRSIKIMPPQCVIQYRIFTYLARLKERTIKRILENSRSITDTFLINLYSIDGYLSKSLTWVSKQETMKN